MGEASAPFRAGAAPSLQAGFQAVRRVTCRELTRFSRGVRVLVEFYIRECTNGSEYASDSALTPEVACDRVGGVASSKQCGWGLRMD